MEKVDLVKLIRNLRCQGGAIFQKIKSNGDRKRRAILGYVGFSDIQNKVAKLVEAYSQLSGKGMYLTPTMILSLAGCGAQVAHYDYDVKVEHSKECFSIFAPISYPGCALEVFEPIKHEVIIGLYDLLVIRGDLAHGGSAYVKDNIRMHFYCELSKLPEGSKSCRKVNQTSRLESVNGVPTSNYEPTNSLQESCSKSRRLVKRKHFLKGKFLNARRKCLRNKPSTPSSLITTSADPVENCVIAKNNNECGNFA
jgi:hypothetical protein